MTNFQVTLSFYPLEVKMKLKKFKPASGQLNRFKNRPKDNEKGLNIIYYSNNSRTLREKQKIETRLFIKNFRKSLILRLE